MEEKNTFFKFIWRLNSLVILAVGAVGLVVLLYGAYQLFKEKTSNRSVSSVVNIEEKPSVNEYYKLEHNSRVFNSKFIAIPLVSVQNYEQSYYSKNARSIKNYLFTNISTSESTWLFDTNKNLILDFFTISKKQFDLKAKDVKALMYKIVNKDTNNDNRLTYKDSFNLGFSSIDGKIYKELLTNLQELSTWQFVNDEKIIVLYQKDNTIFSSNIDLKKLKVIDTKTIPKI